MTDETTPTLRDGGEYEELHQLRTPGATDGELDCFKAPPHLDRVTLHSQELTCHCPVTRQPDFYDVTVRYEPRERCLETKAFKTYLLSFRDGARFCEVLAQTIALDVMRATRAHVVHVELRQQVRGGVQLTAEARVTAADMLAEELGR